jgi:hypothetical protein
VDLALAQPGLHFMHVCLGNSCDAAFGAGLVHDRGAARTLCYHSRGANQDPDGCIGSTDLAILFWSRLANLKLSRVDATTTFTQPRVNANASL